MGERDVEGTGLSGSGGATGTPEAPPPVPQTFDPRLVRRRLVDNAAEAAAEQAIADALREHAD